MIKKTAAYIFLTVGAVTMVGPFMWMVSTSLKNPGDVFSYSKAWWMEWIPTKFVWQNYVQAWNVVPFARFYLNSIFVSVAITVGQVATSAMAAYSFARLRFPGRDRLFFAYLATMMVPGAVTMIPVFILLQKLGWVDSFKALILPSMFTAYGTFMLRQFFMTLPRDLEDAAKIDGCSYTGIFWRIILPLSKPALATLTTFTFMGSWMSFMWPLIVMNTHEKYTLPIGLSYFQSLHGTDWTLLMAGSLMMILPILLVFMFNQRFFVEGIKLAGIKG
ncbi:MAG: carbohydrate ABC transporter permease [Candidatus Omnitrophica bacterium]|nr:carbohydrate ABC transporter permease [Candidatus Omnitrophota bacterium]